MAKIYPRIGGARRSPNKQKDGMANYGKPCIVCKTNTVGQKWIQFCYTRGNDETVNVCDYHWNIVDGKILEFYFKCKKEIKDANN